MGGIRKEREGYIPINGPVNRNQRTLAKEAIVMLLKKGKHTPREIAEHFGLQEEIVNALIDELVKAGCVERMAGKRQYIGIRDPFRKWCQGV
ncbi:MAG: hypothetical protein ACOY40_06665 [Bacillota bacterium]